MSAAKKISNVNINKIKSEKKCSKDKQVDCTDSSTERMLDNLPRDEGSVNNPKSINVVLTSEDVKTTLLDTGLPTVNNNDCKELNGSKIDEISPGKTKNHPEKKIIRRFSTETPKQTTRRNSSSRPVSRNNSIEMKSTTKTTIMDEKQTNTNNNNNNKKPVIKRPLSVCDDKKLNGGKHALKTTGSSSEEDLLSTSLPASAFSTEHTSETTRRTSTGSALTRIGLQDATVDSVVLKHSVENYVTKGFRLITYKTLDNKNVKTSDVVQHATVVYENLVQLQLFLLCGGVSVTTSSSSKSDTLSNICGAMDFEGLKIANNVHDVILVAAKESAKILQNHFIHDKIEFNHRVTTDNKFSLHGMINCILTGKDFLGNKHKNMVQFKITTEKYIPSNSILEMFLYAAIMDIPCVYLLIFHVKDLTVALYEFKFKFDQLREFNRGTTRKLICDNFYRNIYQHTDYKLTFKERKELKM